MAESKSTVPPSSTVIHTQNVHQTAVRKADDYNNTAVSQPASETVASYVKPAPEGGPMPMVNKVYGRGQEIVPEKPKRKSRFYQINLKIALYDVLIATLTIIASLI